MTKIWARWIRCDTKHDQSFNNCCVAQTCHIREAAKMKGDEQGHYEDQNKATPDIGGEAFHRFSSILASALHGKASISEDSNVSFSRSCVISIASL